MSRLSRLLKDEFGAAMVEMAIVIPLLLTLTLGFVDFGYAFYQWNAADKAVQVGARLASNYNPIAPGLVNAVATLPSGDSPGDPVAAGTYDYICTASSAGTASCQNCMGGKCTAAAADQDAFNLLFTGDSGRPGMQTFLPTLQKSELRVEYAATGLDFWTRPGGPVPTITISIVNHPFQFFFLGGLLGFANITMPDMHSTVTGEDLSSGYLPN
jgi:Flp pilus assembly protein TadG